MIERRRESVAVVIAALNASATIGRAIRSALSEPEVSQVIVVDDGSSDGTDTVSLAEDDGSGRLLIKRLPANQGPSAARNHALDFITADHIAILDADDLIVPGRFARLFSTPGWDMIADDILFVADGTDLDSLEIPGSVGKARLLDLPGFINGCVAQPNGVRSQLGFLKPVIRRTLLDEHRLKYEERVRLGEDFLLYLELLRRGARFLLVGSVGYVAVERSNSLSARHATADLEALLEAEQAFARTLPVQSSAALAMARRLAETDAKHALRAFLEEKRQAGIVGALVWLVRRPQQWSNVTTGVVSDKLGDLRRRFRPVRVSASTSRRLLGSGEQASA